MEEHDRYQARMDTKSQIVAANLCGPDLDSLCLVSRRPRVKDVKSALLMIMVQTQIKSVISPRAKDRIWDSFLIHEYFQS